MLKRIIFSLILLIVFYRVDAQRNTSNYEIAYKKALQIYKSADFEKAQKEFEALCNNRVDSPLIPYSFYFNALSFTKLQKYFEAKTTLRNLLALYPNWSQKEEINYLFVNIAFEEKNYVDALNIAQSIDSEPFQDDLTEMKSFYIGQIVSLKILQDLRKKFPDESILFEKKNKVVLNSQSNSSLPNDRQLKGYYNFGILLPLDIESLDPEKPRKNQYALDIYQGMTPTPSHSVAWQKGPSAP